MAPVSTSERPARCATVLLTELLPAPAGPSMATTSDLPATGPVFSPTQHLTERQEQSIVLAGRAHRDADGPVQAVVGDGAHDDAAAQEALVHVGDRRHAVSHVGQHEVAGARRDVEAEVGQALGEPGELALVVAARGLEVLDV